MPQIEPWHRQQALIIASQLPEEIEDALLVLEAAGQLMKGLRQEPTKPLPKNVLAFRQLRHLTGRPVL